MRKPETIEFLERVIMYDRIDRIDAAIRDAHATSGFRPKSVILTGPSGAGKTTIIKRYKKAIPAESTDTHDHIPVLLVEVPPSPDLRSFLMELLRALRHPRPERKATLGEMRLEVVRLAQALKVELIIIDEFHDLLPRHNKNSPKIMKFIKNFMNQLEIPWVLVGLPESSEILESGDGQLRRRFSACRHLPPFAIDSDDEFSLFQGYLEMLQSDMPIKCYRLDEDNMVLRMYCATEGLPGLIANILERLIENHEGDGRASLEDFATAYRQALVHDVRVRDGGVGFNPFLAPMAQVRRAVEA